MCFPIYRLLAVSLEVDLSRAGNVSDIFTDTDRQPVVYWATNRFQHTRNDKKLVYSSDDSSFPRGWSGGRICWVNFKCRGVLIIWIREGQGPAALAVCAAWGCLDFFLLSYIISPFLLPL